MASARHRPPCLTARSHFAARKLSVGLHPDGVEVPWTDLV